MKKTIITISRQYASGGRQIGEKLAKSLGISVYDKELISLAAKQSGFSEKVFENVDKQSANSLLYSLSTGMYNAIGHFDGANNLPLNDKVFLVQYNVIRDLAQKESCVIVGRCADYVLRDNPDVIHVFIHSDMKSRIRRAVEEYGMVPDHAESMILKGDKRRAAYYDFYTGMKWGRVENYDLTIDSDSIGLDNAAKLIEDYTRMRQE
ncbi:MAG: cytidylate kinase-like family protein [Provencibacterium sp.]|nr:cytidylate kinase-like family protein [Provencibacterium sp.]